MKRTAFFALACVLLAAAVVVSCGQRDVNPMIEVSTPPHFPPMIYDLNKNPVTQAGFELGRALFYEGQLSRDGTVSCGFCHQQSAGFTHHGHDLSHGVDDRLGKRNALPIQNLAFYRDFMWDGGIHDLDLQPLAPIENPVEMDESMPNILEKLRKHPHYPRMFERAFGTPEITGERLLKALSQFMVTMISANSRYDQYLRGETQLTADELRGLQLFKQKGCDHCHSGGLFTDQTYRNNGLSLAFNQDVGRYEITLNEQDKYKFRVPSLRNVEVTRPYMHDGRFRNLEMVLDHYSEGMEDIPTLDPLFKRTDGKRGIPMTAEEKRLIIAFLKTLTDETFLHDKRFSEPE
ncbi:MAG: cytochrome c peroxidase [Cytophagales bacterium]|nr:cytochrome-c peroxidase [Bernardetiaceae bacterium]MDW8204652.1 cytochrome c peroxidase [Cytophagales bacterium]